MMTRINALRPQLRRSEQKVADLVLANPETVTGLSIASLARDAAVSEPTVIRFCRAIGCNGFQDFKLRMAASLASGMPFVASAVSTGDSAATLSGKVFDRAIACLVQARNQLNTEALDAAVELLNLAPRIEFYGHGASGLVALDMQHKFFRLGIPTIAYSDPHVHGMSAAALPANSVVVAISHTGRTTDLLRSAELAREAGAHVIAITACGSPLARMSTVALYAEVSEDTDTYSPLVSRLAYLTVCDVLAVALALRRGPAVADTAAHQAGPDQQAAEQP